jgi:hypothetical protein
MTSRVAARLARLEHNARTGSRRIVVVERESLEAVTAFLQGRADVDMDRIIFCHYRGPAQWPRPQRLATRGSRGLTFLASYPSLTS